MTQRADNKMICTIRWARRERPAFTLIEVLLAIGALALIAVGMTQIFSATGRTVSAGRRISVMNSYATLIERQMRADFAAISRDGPMIIRHEEANGGWDVQLDEEDLPGRPRRVDELMFFTTGHFISAREPLYPGYVAASDAARVYYGHGKRMLVPISYNSNDPYYRPVLNEANDQADATLGIASLGPASNPNRYASGWTLLRHVTLLRPPATTELPVPGPFPAGLINIPDRDVQVALQPATSFIFRKLAAVIPDSIPSDFVRTPMDRPAFSSGLVDIATTDLSEIRSLLMTLQADPDGPDGINNEADLADPNKRRDGDFAAADLNRIRLWMVESLPSGNPLALNPLDRTRIRYEDGPTDLLGVIGDPLLTTTQENYRRSDQFMLQASNFVPHCSEFIVEWSYGVVDSGPTAANTNQLVWHGLDPVNVGDVAIRRYPQTPDRRPAPHTVRYRKSNGSLGTHLVGADLIYDSNADALVLERILPTYFGYTDPTFAWTSDGPESIPWAWPRLVRITIGLADPNEPGFEEKFQFIFEVPSSDG